jgi:large repetitive protein
LTPCSGTVLGSPSSPRYDLTDWIWATEGQVRTVLSLFTPDILSSSFLTGSQYLTPARIASISFGGTNSLICAGGCSVGQFSYLTDGWTAGKDAAGNPIAATVQALNTTSVVNTGTFSFVAQTPAQTNTRGIYLWRPTGLGTGLVVANADSAVAQNLFSGVVIANVLENDWNNGVRASTANVTLSLVSSSNPGLTLNTSTGAVSKLGGIGVGVHTLNYRICSTTTSSCDDAVVRVESQPILTVNADSGAITTAGGVAIANVLANDTYDGLPATLAEVSLVQTSAPVANISLNTTTGQVIVPPNTPAGNYSLVYRIVDKTVAKNSGTATASVFVTDPNAVIQANADAYLLSASGGTVNVMGNDTYGGIPANLNFVDMSLVQPPAGFTITSNGYFGLVKVPAGLAPGVYGVDYRLCDKTNTANCSTARLTVTIMAPLVVSADVGTVTTTGGVAIANVLANDLYGGQPATTANVTINVSGAPNGITLNTATGQVTVAPGLAAGQYSLFYNICDKAVPTNQNCSSYVAVTITVTAPTVVLVATADAGTVTTSGGVAIANVLSNDLYNGQAATTATVALSAVQAAAGVSLNATTGQVSVNAGAAPGSYALDYRICARIDPANCATARASVTVRANAIDAVADSGTVSSRAGGTAISNVLANDRLEGGAVTTATVTLAVVGTVPRGLTFNTTTGGITVASRTSSGTYVVNYRICERAAASNCDQAAATVRVNR